MKGFNISVRIIWNFFPKIVSVSLYSHRKSSSCNVATAAKSKRLASCHLKSLRLWHLHGSTPARTVNNSAPRPRRFAVTRTMSYQTAEFVTRVWGADGIISLQTKSFSPKKIQFARLSRNSHEISSLSRFLVPRQILYISSNLLNCPGFAPKPREWKTDGFLSLKTVSCGHDVPSFSKVMLTKRSEPVLFFILFFFWRHLLFKILTFTSTSC